LRMLAFISTFGETYLTLPVVTQWQGDLPGWPGNVIATIANWPPGRKLPYVSRR
jgi:hypothetical protein